MDEPPIELIEPTVSMRDAYLEFVAEFRPAGERDIPGAAGMSEEDVKADFAAYVRRLNDSAKGVGLPAGWVPASTYWLVRGGRVIGVSNLRHRLTEALLDYGGHIGYSVRPAERGKGYATLLLRLTLEKARQLGIGRVLVTCDKANIASARVIQKNGGVLESESHSPQAGRVTQRYWISLRGPGPRQEPPTE